MIRKQKKKFSVIMIITTMLLFLISFTSCMEIDGFEKHLADAIKLNTERKKIYAEMTDGRSNFLFTALIGFETALIPLAKTTDYQAIPFLKEGIPIVVNDFVPMNSVNDFTVPPVYYGEMNDESIEEVKEIISRINKLHKDDFVEISHVVYEALSNLDRVEVKHQVHFQMTKHLLESLGFAALHAILYTKQSDGRTDSLSKKFIMYQLLPFKTSASLFYDKRANHFHQEGIGVLINEMPYIPFIEEYELYFTE